MEHWNHKSLRQHRFQHRRERQNPSFSSSLLDQIYHSIDQLDHQHQPPALAMKHQQRPSSKTGTTSSSTSSSSSSSSRTVFGDKELDLANFQRACLIEKWMDQKKKKKPAPNSESTKSGSAREFTRNSRQNGDAMLLNSSSSSSDSSCGGLFSSDSTETNYVVASTKSMMSSSSGSYTDHRPKPILTSTQPADLKKSSKYDINIGGGFVKTKSKALKIYSDLKKARQPISPGGKLANFLNSIFNTSIMTSGAATASSKKPKNDGEDDQRKSKSAQASTCSSATSFSRSCLSKTPTSSSSGGKSSEKRSVRFSPVSVMIVNQQDKYVGDNVIIREKSCISEEISIHTKEKNRRIEEAARDLLANYQKKVDQCHEIMEEDDDDDDDDASCASSDLFELDNLSSIPGIERYCKELPVYETTHFHTNPPIPTGFII